MPPKKSKQEFEAGAIQKVHARCDEEGVPRLKVLGVDFNNDSFRGKQQVAHVAVRFECPNCNKEASKLVKNFAKDGSERFNLCRACGNSAAHLKAAPVPAAAAQQQQQQAPAKKRQQQPQQQAPPAKKQQRQQQQAGPAQEKQRSLHDFFTPARR